MQSTKIQQSIAIGVSGQHLGPMFDHADISTRGFVRPINNKVEGQVANITPTNVEVLDTRSFITTNRNTSCSWAKPDTSMIAALHLDPATPPKSHLSSMEWFVDARSHFEAHFSQVIVNIASRPGLGTLVPAAVNPGRRIRPTLYCALWKAAHGEFPEGSDILPALALELFHSASIVVDDIADREETRRNKQSFFKIYDVDTAILISHLLIAEGGTLLASHPHAAGLLKIWSDAYIAAAEGQAYSIRRFNDVAMEEQYGRSLAKTSSFFTFIAEALTTCAHVPIPRLTSSLGAIGECFQLSNDVIDLLFFVESQRYDPERSYPLRPSATVIRLVEAGLVDAQEIFAELPFARHRDISVAANNQIPDAEAYLRSMFQPVQDKLDREPLLFSQRALLADFLTSTTTPVFWLHHHG